MPELKSEDAEKMRRDDLRAEYSAIVSYHIALVTARFTIAGLLTGGSAFLAVAAFSADRPASLKALSGAFALWLTVCIGILELRNRSLYRNIAQRGIQIEREQWGLTGKDCYIGFFSRQYKIVPPTTCDGSLTATHPGSDVFTVFGRPLKWVSHSTGFNLLYIGAIIFWLLVTVYYGYMLVRPGDDRMKNKLPNTTLRTTGSGKPSTAPTSPRL